MSTMVLAPVTTTVRRPVAGRSPSVRLTRRGRVVLVVAGLLMALAVALVFAGGAVGTDEAGTPALTETVTVAPGDTLWGIASDVAAGDDVRDMMKQIERLNALDSAVLQAGQKLRVPVVEE